MLGLLSTKNSKHFTEKLKKITGKYKIFHREMPRKWLRKLFYQKRQCLWQSIKTRTTTNSLISWEFPMTLRYSPIETQVEWFYVNHADGKTAGAPSVAVYSSLDFHLKHLNKSVSVSITSVRLKSCNRSILKNIFNSPLNFVPTLEVKLNSV